MAVRSTTGEVDVVGMGAGGSLLYFSSTPPYSNWTRTTIPGPGTTISNPVITVRSVDPSGEVDVVATSDDALWYYQLLPGATSWRVYLPLPVTGLPMGVVARSSGPEGELDVLATDNANLTLRYLWWSGADNIYGLPAWYSAIPANFCDSYDYSGTCK